MSTVGRGEGRGCPRQSWAVIKQNAYRGSAPVLQLSKRPIFQSVQEGFLRPPFPPHPLFFSPHCFILLLFTLFPPLLLPSSSCFFLSILIFFPSLPSFCHPAILSSVFLLYTVLPALLLPPLITCQFSSFFLLSLSLYHFVSFHLHLFLSLLLMTHSLHLFSSVTFFSPPTLFLFLSSLTLLWPLIHPIFPPTLRLLIFVLLHFPSSSSWWCRGT